jgi:elongation factor G
MAGANTGAGGGSVSAPASPAEIRNVVLVGPSGAGKTTLLEAMLASTGTIPRAGRTTEGTTVSDFDDAEIRQQRSVGLALAPVVVEGTKVNFLDTPGYADFVGDLRAGLRAADAALFVVSAVDGVDGGTQMLWEECAAVGMPRAVVVTRLDHARADFDELVAICQRTFGEGVMPLMLPMLADDGTPAGFIDLITERIHDYSSGSRVDREPEATHQELIETTRASLIEGIIAESEDETLMDRYLAGEHIDVETLITDLEKAVARGSFYPVLGTAVELDGLGTAEVLDLVRRGFPSPLEHPLPPVTTPDGQPRGPLSCDPAGPMCAEVVKTTTDPYVGRLSLVRVFSGTVSPDAVVHVSGHFAEGRGHEDHDVDERIGALSSPLGKVQRTIDRGIAGDIVAVAKLTRAETGDTLSDKDNPLLMSPSSPSRRPTRTSSARPSRDSWQRTPRCGWTATPRPVSWCSGAWVRRTWTSCSTGWPIATASPWSPSRFGSRCARRSRPPRRGTAATSSSPAGTVSTRSATSR